MMRFAHTKNLPALATLLCSFFCGFTYAVDKPDTQDYITEFRERAEVHKQAAEDPKRSVREILVAYNEYQTFLQKELDKTFKLLLSKIPTTLQGELELSQHNWKKFRDSEIEFIMHNWSAGNFGDSASRSRAKYRCSIIESRVIQLLQYTKSY